MPRDKRPNQPLTFSPGGSAVGDAKLRLVRILDFLGQ
jgi:hypothetical protein